MYLCKVAVEVKTTTPINTTLQPMLFLYLHSGFAGKTFPFREREKDHRNQHLDLLYRQGYERIVITIDKELSDCSAASD